MEALFAKSLRERLLEAGAREISLGNGMLALTPHAGWFHRYRWDGSRLISCTRALLDWAVREGLMAQTTKVSIHQATVEGLIGDAQRVRGVRISGAESILGSEVEADFVVDTSGRGSRNLQWLRDIGVDGVAERKVDSGLTNATRIYRTPAGAESFPMTMIQANPYNGRPGRSAMVLPIEGNRWMVSAGGTRGGEPPSDPQGFLEYIFSLPHPIVGRLVSGAEPLTDIAVSRSTSNVRRYFEKTAVWPERFLVLGDALATFNPAYGQGMSVAALGARDFFRALQQFGIAGPGLARRVLREAAGHVETAWSTAVATDVFYPDVKAGSPTLADRMTAAYARRLTRAATGSLPAAAALFDVTSLTAGPTRVLRPRALLAALTGSPLPQLSEPPLFSSERQILQRLTDAAVHPQGAP